MTPPHIEPVWIATDEQLRECCETLAQSRAIAVDTEFMRSNTFYPNAALFQLFAGEHCYLVDPLTVRDFSPLVKLLTDPAVIKVFHSCSEDLEVFNHFLGCVPEPLVDTQLAAGFLEHGSSCSYAALVEAVLGVKLEKGETRSDWLQRPLDSKQLQYAVQDVHYLLPLYEALVEALNEAERLNWLREDCELLVAAAKTPAEPDDFYPRIKSAWKLRPRGLAALRALSLWREREARERNKPRNHILHERVLWSLAQQQPQSLPDLKRIEDMDPRKIRQYGEVVLAVIEEAQALAEADCPPALPAPLPVSERDLMKALKAAAVVHAEELGLAAEMLAKKSDYEFIIRSGMNGGEYRLPGRLLGWRRSVIGETLLDIARKQGAGE